MKNIFSLTTNEILSSYPDKEDVLGQLIYRYIPLGEDTILGFKSFKSKLIEMIKEAAADSDVIKLAELTLSLCEPYLKYEIPTTSTEFLNNLTSKDNLIPLAQIKDFQESIYSEGSFIDDLKTFMILSYVHTQSNSGGTIPKNAVYEIINQRKPLPSKNKDTYNSSDPEKIKSRPLYDKLFKIYATKKKGNMTNGFEATPFLPSFLDYEKDRLIFKSWYDTEIILGLINSDAKSKNPFVYSTTNKPTNIKLFLKAFQDISLNENRRIDILSYVDKKRIEKIPLSESKLYVYNQFILERIGNFNFINKLYLVQQNTSLPTTNSLALMELVNCPLLRFRLTLLEYYENQHQKYFKNHLSLLPEWNFYLLKAILHQISCTLPILDLIFHYLAHLANKYCSFHSFFQDSINKYFDALNKSTSFTFFEYNNTEEFVPIPSLYKFPSKLYDKSYTELSKTVYENLVYKSFYISKNESIINKIEHIYYAQQDFLKKELTNIQTSLNIIR